TNRDYLGKAAQMLGLSNREERPQEGAPITEAEPTAPPMDGKKPIDKDEIKKATQLLKDYKAGKVNLETRIVEEERWWKQRHWDVIRGKHAIEVQANPEEARPEPTSAWMCNSIANKHADVMDNYPEPNVLPREPADEQDAQILSSILPVVFERNEYERTFSRASWYKLKHGVVDLI
ncbi:hypothetical protein, partial [Enterococcus faecalis]|uniref:hypothetical protein n=1 Tax=Enterococcus faecalis TaxID=1351 RepID=UPI001AD6260A